MTRTLWRELLYKEIKDIELYGSVLDLGGSRKSAYHSLLGGQHKITVVNIDKEQGINLSFNLENRFDIINESYDNVLCFNVLEHVFNYHNLLQESHRTLKNNGKIVLAVPFLIQIHPSPHDHWRFSKETLEKLFTKVGFKDIEIHTIGTGLFGATYQLLHNFYRFGFIQSFFKILAKIGDQIIFTIKPGSTFSKEYYPLGYLVIARK